MSDRYSFIVKGFDARVTVEHGRETTQARTIVFDDESDSTEIIYSTPNDSTRYSGYCTAEIISRQLFDALLTRRQIEAEDIGAALEAQGLECRCDDDDDDEY